MAQSRPLFLRINFITQGFLLLLAAILLQSLVHRNNRLEDRSMDGRFTLKNGTVQLLGNFGRAGFPLTCHIFIRREMANTQWVDQMMRLVGHHCPVFSHRFVDIDRDPASAIRFGIKSYGVLVLEYRDRIKKLTRFDEETIYTALLEIFYDQPRQFLFAPLSPPDYFSESSLPEGFSQWVEAIRNDGCDTLFPTNFDPIDTSASSTIVVIAGQKRDMSASETQILDRFLDRGGGLFFLVEFGTPRLFPETMKFLARRGIIIHGDLIIDRHSAQFGDTRPFAPLVSSVANHPLTQSIASLSFKLPLCHSLDWQATRSGDTARRLLFSSELTWGEKSIESAFRGNFQLDPGEARGPLTTALLVHSGGPIFILGSSRLGNNSTLHLFGNRDLLLNGGAFLSGRTELLGQRGKSFEFQPLILGDDDLRGLWFVALFILPPGVLLFGSLLILWRRRRTS